MAETTVTATPAEGQARTRLPGKAIFGLFLAGFIGILTECLPAGLLPEISATPAHRPGVHRSDRHGLRARDRGRRDSGVAPDQELAAQERDPAGAGHRRGHGDGGRRHAFPSTD
ncbi:MAG TPA: hypothetical protein VGJ45_02050 [Pseudonocardiaceae bacterium]